MCDNKAMYMMSRRKAKKKKTEQTPDRMNGKRIAYIHLLSLWCMIYSGTNHDAKRSRKISLDTIILETLFRFLILFCFIFHIVIPIH